MPITHLTFDFFGTLVKYKHGHFAGNTMYTKSYNFLQKYHYPYNYERFTSDYVTAFEKLTKKSLETYTEFHMDEVTNLFLENTQLSLSKSQQKQFTETYLNEWNSTIDYFPNIQSFIANLKKKYTLSIISNTHYSPLVHNNAKSMKIHNDFASIVTSVDHGKLKPHPSIFLDTLNDLKANPQQSFHIGDNFHDDYEGALNAGIQCILIDPDKRYINKVSYRVDSLFDIAKFL